LSRSPRPAPQRYHLGFLRPGAEKGWPAEVKDDLKHRLCEMVCSGELDVREAQKEIADDWIESYRRRFRRATK
jgi:hypothetical protein